VSKVSRSLLFVIFLILSLGGFAQTYQTNVNGTVTDPTGAPIRNAQVRIVNRGTNEVRTTMTGDAGSYYVGNLPIGRYNVTVTADNFETQQIGDVQLVVGQSRQLNVALKLGSVSQEVQVVDSAPPLATNTAEIGGVIENQQIRDLPLNGRNIASLMALVPGAIDSGGGSLSSVRFAGRGNDDTNFRLDGIDATGIATQSQDTTLRLTTSTESIAEFKVATLLYGADVGGTAGGQVDLVSKSGTNHFHGGLFDFFRNNYFDSKGPYDAKTPNLKLNDFGASLGGPIVRDRTFFFWSYEGLRQIVSTSLVAHVPSEAFRAQVLAQAPVLTPFIMAYPHANGALVDANTAVYDSPAGTRQSEDSYLARIQHTFNEKNNMFARYSVDHANITAPSGSLRDTTAINESPMNATVQYVHVFSDTLVNQAALGFNRAGNVTDINSYLDQSQGIKYSLSIGGIAPLASPRSKNTTPSTYAILDNLTKTIGQHTIKTGIELREVQFNYNQPGKAALQYNGYSQFLNNKLDGVSVVADIPMHGLHKLETFAYIMDTFKLRSNLTLTYGLRWEFFNTLHEVHGKSLAWDDVTCGGNCPVGGQFTIPVYNNFEPRFSFGYEPHRFHGRAVLRGGVGVYHGEGQLGDLNAPSDNFTTLFGLTPNTSPGLSWPVDPYVAQAAQNPQAVQPRGLARKRQDPRVTQYGLQFQTALPFSLILDTGYIGSWGDHQFTRTYHNNYIIGTLTRPLPGFGQVDYKGAISTSNFNGWQTSLQRQIRDGLGFQFNYLWSHSLNDGTTGGGEATYPNNVNCLGCEYASSDQDVRHTISSNAIWDLPIGREKRFINRGWASTLVSGLSLNPIFTYRSGLPINVVLSRPANRVDSVTGKTIIVVPDGNNTEHSAGSPNLRPDLVPGVSLTPREGRSNSGNTSRWINPDAFAVPRDGTWGNLPRNYLRGPGLWQADLGMGKRFKIHEGLSGQLRAEMFNIFNRYQYGNASGNFTSVGNAEYALRNNTDPTKVASLTTSVANAKLGFANTTSTVNGGATGSGTPRRIQFALRFDF